MELRIRDSGKVVQISEFRSMLEAAALEEGKCLSLPASPDWNEFGADVIFYAPAPEAPNGKRAVPDGYTQDSKGNWVNAWKFEDIPAEETATQLAAAKEAKNAQINAWRMTANTSTFTYQGKQIACDALSRSDIDAVAGSIALTGTFPAGFPNAWKAIDNTYIPIVDVAAFKAMYAAMTNQGTLNFGHAQQLKQALANATTLEEVNAIVW